MKTTLSGWASLALLAGGALVLAGTAPAQDWKPERPIELTIPAGPGGSNDITARIVQKIWSNLNLLPVPSSVMNRGGGGHVVAYTYLRGRAGDPYSLSLVSTPLLMNYATGRSKLSYKDVTPIAMLTDEPMVVVVRVDSPLKTGQDLLDALKKDPGSLSIALTSDGHRVSIGLPLQKAGISIKGIRIVAFKSGGETTTALMGGHADVVITSVSSLIPHATAGKLRGIAVSSSKRLGGPVADMPTWQELGYPSSGSWKGIAGPPGLTPEQVEYWEGVMRTTAQSEELAAYAQKNQWLIAFKGSAETVQWMEEESARLKDVVQALGLVRKKK
ncbi:MAG TPA: tripartite tricarboxylate transporter substrate binding protein [Burkholderiales bacterium]|jgi:putative tricarboxylic transport membrane protein|nr:tripartite tricarboxylate transporter substrate binding protein [Burkholderiales bacterium]